MFCFKDMVQFDFLIFPSNSKSVYTLAHVLEIRVFKWLLRVGHKMAAKGRTQNGCSAKGRTQNGEFQFVI